MMFCRAATTSAAIDNTVKIQNEIRTLSHSSPDAAALLPARLSSSELWPLLILLAFSFEPTSLRRLCVMLSPALSLLDSLSDVLLGGRLRSFKKLDFRSDLKVYTGVNKKMHIRLA